MATHQPAGPANSSGQQQQQQPELDQEQQHQQHAITTDNDESTTNCSEIMSTSANEDEECFEPMVQVATGSGNFIPEASTSGLAAARTVVVHGDSVGASDTEPAGRLRHHDEQSYYEVPLASSNCHNQNDDGVATLMGGSGDGDMEQGDNVHNGGAVVVDGSGQVSEEQPLTEYLAISPQETDGGGCSMRSELSLFLASGANQAEPPSYGTATRLCATLDASQLRDALNAAQVQQQQQGSRDFRFAPPTSQSHYGLSHLAGQQQQQQANHYSNASLVQLRAPLFNGIASTTIRGYNPTLPMRTQHQQQQQQPFQLARSSTIATVAHPSQSSSYSSNLSAGGGSLNRSNFMAIQPAHLNGALGFGQVDEFRGNNVGASIASNSTGQQQQQQQQHHQINLRPDNNRADLSQSQKLLLQQQQQQVAVSNLEQQLAPINHVISALGSIQWQPQTNQCYLPGSLITTSQPATNYGIPSRLVSLQQQPQQLAGTTAQLDGRSSRKSTRIMDAPFAWPAAVSVSGSSSFKGDQLQQTKQQQQQPPATNRNEPLKWQATSDHPHPPAHSSHLPASISGSSITNVNGSVLQQHSSKQRDIMQHLQENQTAHTKHNQHPIALSSLKQQQQHWRQHNNNSNNNSNDSNDNPKRLGSQPLMRSKISPSRRSDENLDQSGSRRHQQQQQQPANRKRRRHRSTSGRSVSPESGQVRTRATACDGENDDCALEEGGDRLVWPMPPPPPSSSSRLLSDVATNSANANTNTSTNTTTTTKQLSGGNNPETNNHKRTISAHCWLIDSSDDQTYAPSKRSQEQRQPSAASVVRKCASELEANNLKQYHYRSQKLPATPQTTHLTVAMMKQTLEQQQQRLKQTGDPNVNVNRNQYVEQYPSAKYLTQPHQNTSTTNAAADDDDDDDQHPDLTVSLRTNSLRMERILNRSPGTAHNKDSQLMAGQSGSRTMPATRRHKNRRNRRYLSSASPSSSMSSSASSLSNTKQTSNATSAANKHNSSSGSGRVVAPRLSTLLTLLANIVRPSRSSLKSSLPARSGVATDGSELQNRRQKQQQQQQRECEDSYPTPAAPANSISGSILARSGANASGPNSLGPYTAGGSMAISSSSSTSAYATESSSHLSSSTNPLRLLAHLNMGQISLDRPMAGMLRNHPHHHQQPHSHTSQVAPSCASTAGSSLFYSSSGNSSGLQMSTTSGSHGYEYCDDVDRINETKFVGNCTREQAINEEETESRNDNDNDNHHPHHHHHHLMIEATSSSSRSQASSNDNDDLVAGSSGDKHKKSGLIRHSNLMSDNELLSAGSEAGFQGAGGGNGPAGPAGASLAAVVSQATPSIARRRWWWISLKDVLCRRPCGRATGSSSAADSEEGALACEPAQRYKSLRSRRHPPSTLENVLSLAKADRVFRARLLASLLVSCILLGLIGLLCALIYSRSTQLYQRTRLGLLIDDNSDYDLSWLWPHDSNQPFPGQLQQQASTSSFASSSGDSHYRVLELQLAANAGSGTQRSPAEQLMMDGSLRGPLIMIEQSEQLAQYQQTIGYMTNLQLANDKFIDLTQMASRLMPMNTNEMMTNSTNQPPSNNSTATMPTGSQREDSISPKKRPTTTTATEQQITDQDQELISLTLLSNLHWPLVKWRHQNQQSITNFLSSFTYSSSSASGAVQPHLRSLLSVLLLAEANSSEMSPVTGNSNSSSLMQQFSRLNYLLKSSSHQIISCTNQLNELSHHFRLGPLRRRFCESLLARYKRMMLILSQLNHSHLIKLRDHMEPTTTTTTTSNRMQQMQSTISSRTLLSFFLDRLSLLDVDIIAESTLASANQDDFNSDDSVIGLRDEDDDDGKSFPELGYENGNLEKRALASILTHHTPSISSADLLSTKSSSSSVNKSLLDLSKSIIGEIASSTAKITSAETAEVNTEWVAQLKQLEMENSGAWRELLARDLLYPWPSHKLPHFIRPQNYDLFLHPNLTTRLVLGMVKIGFRLERPTRFIVLHCDKLNLVDVSLWLKQTEPSRSPDIDRNSSSGHQQQQQSDLLQRVPIRRILSNAKLEQIYIELQYELYPSTKSNNVHQRYQSSTLNFGGELPLHEVINSENLYILSVSFNKTSLMENRNFESTQTFDDGNSRDENGLEFLQYADYFAQSEAELKTILYTQFEPQNARRLFPAFDEPQFKAKFQLNLVHESGHQVLFNAPKRERVPYTADGSHQMSVFEQTPLPLSTYLVAFVVCDSQNMKSITSRASQLQSTSGESRAATKSTTGDQKHIQVQILAQFEQLGQAEFASQLVPQLLAFYQNHLNFPYPMDKLDLVAIPRAIPQITTNSIANNKPQPSISIKEQQRIKAMESYLPISNSLRLNTMENMGLIWFKANILLVDTNLISQNLIEQVAMVISHQLAHQYFGNIVSISQWTDLWLYESLCQYLESMALNQVQPDWRLEEQFVVTSIQDTLALEQFDWPQLFRLANSELISSKLDHQAALISGDHLQSNGDGNLEPDTSDELEMADTAAELLSNFPSSSSPDHLSQLTPTGQEDMLSSSTISLNRMQDSNELRRNSAILHMLLLNLLPTPEARARLLSRCLSNFRYGTMSSRQFWRQFGEQLTKEGSSERLALALEFGSHSTRPILMSSLNSGDTISLAATEGLNDLISIHTDKWLNSSGSGTENAHQSVASSDSALPNERVVFVRTSSAASGRRMTQVENGSDMHKIHVRSAANHLTQSLDQTVAAWLEQRGYPLITASFQRDRIQLRQEHFSFAWWNEAGLLDDEPMVLPEALKAGDEDSSFIEEANRTRRMASLPNVAASTPELGPTWTIPLMFVSRVNPKQARFFWMDKREMELPLQELSYSSVQDYHLAPISNSNNNMELRTTKSHLNVWFKLNVNQSSLVRVNYDERNWEALTELLLKSHYSNHVLGPLDRANLIDDAITLMRCGKLSVGVAMNLTLYLEVGEREFMPWTSTLRHLDQMQTLLNQNPLWHRYVLKLMQPISSVIGWKDDGPHLMRKLRRSLFSVALQYGDEKTINKAKQEFKGWFKSGRFIVPNLQELVYVAGVRYGDQQEWFHCWQKYQQLIALELGSSQQQQQQQQQQNEQQNQTGSDGSTRVQDVDGFVRTSNINGRDRQLPTSPLLAASVANNPFGSMVEQNEPNAEDEKRQLLTALASTHNTWLLEQFLNYSLDSTKIQPHHLKHVMQTLGKNPVARLYLWRFVRLNWNSLIDRYILGGFPGFEPPNLSRYPNDRFRGSSDTEDYQILETMIIESTKHFVTKLDYDEVKTFFETKRKQHKQRPDSTLWVPSLEQAIQQSLQVIRSNIHWRNYVEPKLTKWLSHYDSSIIQ